MPRRDITGEHMGTGHDIIIYASVMALSIITFYGFIKIGVDKIARTVTARPATFILLSLFTVGCLGIGIKNLAFEPDMKMLLPEKVWLLGPETKSRASVSEAKSQTISVTVPGYSAMVVVSERNVE